MLPPEGEVEVNSTSIGTWIWREELMAKALEIWSLEVIEEALGADAARVLPDAIRLIDIHLRIPAITFRCWSTSRSATTLL